MGEKYSLSTPGMIDDVRVYSCALSQDSIRALAAVAPTATLAGATGATTGAAQTTSTTSGSVSSSCAPTALYKFTESALSSDVVDSSGNSNTGSIVGSLTRATTPYPALQSAGGFGNYVRVPRSISIEPTAAITIAAWVKLTDSGTSYFSDIIRKADPNAGIGYFLRWSHGNGRLSFTVRSTAMTNWVDDTQLNVAYLNEWHHFAGVYSSATGVAQLYVDGILKSQNTAMISSLEHREDMTLMGQSYPGHLSPPGLATDIRVYGCALDAANVRALAAAVPSSAPTSTASVPVVAATTSSTPTAVPTPSLAATTAPVGAPTVFSFPATTTTTTSTSTTTSTQNPSSPSTATGSIAQILITMATTIVVTGKNIADFTSKYPELQAMIFSFISNKFDLSYTNPDLRGSIAYSPLSVEQSTGNAKFSITITFKTLTSRRAALQTGSRPKPSSATE